MRQKLRVNSSCSYEVWAVHILDGFQIVPGGNLIVDAMVNLKRLIQSSASKMEILATRHSRLKEHTQEAKYVESWPNTTSAWAGWSRFAIPVDRYDGVHSLLICTSSTLVSPTVTRLGSRIRRTY